MAETAASATPAPARTGRTLDAQLEQLRGTGCAKILHEKGDGRARQPDANS